MNTTFPGTDREQKSPDELGFDTEKFAAVKASLQESAGDKRYQVGIARYGYLAAKWR